MTNLGLKKNKNPLLRSLDNPKKKDNGIEDLKRELMIELEVFSLSLGNLKEEFEEKILISEDLTRQGLDQNLAVLRENWDILDEKVLKLRENLDKYANLTQQITSSLTGLDRKSQKQIQDLDISLRKNISLIDEKYLTLFKDIDNLRNEDNKSFETHNLVKKELEELKVWMGKIGKTTYEYGSQLQVLQNSLMVGMTGVINFKNGLNTTVHVVPNGIGIDVSIDSTGGGPTPTPTNVQSVNLSSQCNGSTKTFTLPTFAGILLLTGSQFPVVYNPDTDFTILDSTHIALTSAVSAPETGQTLIALTTSTVPAPNDSTFDNGKFDEAIFD